MWCREGKKERRLVYIGEQKSEEWHLARKGRVTGSRAAAARGKSQFKTIKQTADIICGRVAEEVNDAMRWGMEKEPDVRAWYEKTRKVQVKEIGFAFLEDLPKIGVSPDGLVEEDGLIEIKCPQKMYWQLAAQAEKEKKGKKIWWNEDGSPEHIFTSHYDQMQLQMGVMERQWCDYLVAVFHPDGRIHQVYSERIYFNLTYYRNLLQELMGFANQYLGDTMCYVPDEKNILTSEKKNIMVGDSAITLAKTKTHRTPQKEDVSEESETLSSSGQKENGKKSKRLAV